MQSPLNGIEDKNRALDKTTNHLLSQLLRFETLQIMMRFIVSQNLITLFVREMQLAKANRSSETTMKDSKEK
jgi:hypothetical protein